jgi:hypothetical protein
VTQAVAEAADRAVVENPIDSVDPSRFGQLSAKALEITCSTCGSAVQFEPPDVAGCCPFCDAKIVAQPVSPDPLIAPDGLLPFSLLSQQASGNVKSWLSGLWFAPSDLQRLAQPDRLNGVYLPFWTFDAATYSRYEGQRGDAYYEEEIVETTDSNGRRVRQLQQVRRIRWTPVSGAVNNAFDDILVPASKSLPNNRLSALEPWDLPSVKPYEPAFLAGFKAQRYQLELPDGFETAKSIMAGTISEAASADIGGDEQRISRIDTQYSGVTFKHLLLPVWLGAYRYQGKVFQVLVNARTGEVQGDRPYSAAKITLTVLAAIIAILLLYVLTRR